MDSGLYKVASLVWEADGKDMDILWDDKDILEMFPPDGIEDGIEKESGEGGG